MCLKPNKNDFEKFLVTHWVIWVRKMRNLNPLGFQSQKTKEKEPKRKIKIYFMGCWVKGFRFEV